MMIDSNASVVLAAERHIDAPASVVWDVLTDVEGWPTWHSGIRSVIADRAPGVGMTFRWRPGPYQITSMVQEFEPQERSAGPADPSGSRHGTYGPSDRMPAVSWCTPTNR